MPRESKADLTKRAAEITRKLKNRYPNARTALNYSNALELLVATILSAQCTDKRVNTVTPDLFRKYPTARHFAEAPQEVLEEEIRSTGFYRNKAKSIRGTCTKIIADFGGNVPDNMADLLSLPGVARKTANVVLGDVFGKREGIVVDTHVARISQRLKLTRQASNQSDKIEKDLMAVIRKKDWTIFAHLLIFHGRETCRARKPNCAECVVSEHCPSASKV